MKYESYEMEDGVTQSLVQKLVGIDINIDGTRCHRVIERARTSAIHSLMRG